jgi:hypothetical protein
MGKRTKFHVGDTITSTEVYKGFEKARITSIDSQYYHVAILCGTATIPIHTAENNYKLLKE